MSQTGLSTTDLSRQLHRLISDVIIEKTPADLYQLTQYGRLMASSIPLMTFLKDYKQYFNTRDLSSIPDELVNTIGSLRDGEMVNSIYESIKLQQELVPTIRERFWMMTDDLSAEWIGTTLKLVEEGVEVKALLTPELAEKISLEAPSKLLSGIQVRKMSPIKLVLGYSDKHALLCFSALNGKPDRNHYFFGYDFRFKHWVFHCFNHYWRQASPV